MALTARKDALGEIREHLAPRNVAGPGAGTKGILGLLRAAVGARASQDSIRDGQRQVARRVQIAKVLNREGVVVVG